MLARFTARFPEVKVSLASGNSEQVEAALARHDTDLGLVESSARHPGFHYEPFIPDELVLIASTKGRYGRCDQVTLAELQTVPLVLRESGSGTLEVISKYLAAADVRLASLRVVMQLGSTESIKSFVRNSDAMAIVSVISVVDELRSGVLRIIDLEDLPRAARFRVRARRKPSRRLSSGSSSSSQGPTVDRAGFLAQPRRAYLP